MASQAITTATTPSAGAAMKTPEDVLRYWAFREDAAQPVPRIGNRRRLPPFETPRAGIFVAKTTQIYPEDRGTNYSLRLGGDVARVIAERHG